MITLYTTVGYRRTKVHRIHLFNEMSQYHVHHLSRFSSDQCA